MRGVRSAVALGFILSLSSLANAQDAFETKPDIHGDAVVFTAEGDLWLGSISGHSAKRITSDALTETDAKFSPDGKWIAFSGQYEGGLDVYLMSVQGGPPKRLTYDPAIAEVQGWTPDGSNILFRSRRPTGNVHVTHLFEVSAKGGPAKLVAVPEAEFGSMGPGGKLAYVPFGWEWANWFHYRGGGADQIWLADLNGHKFTKLTNTDGIETTPVWAGGAIYFVSERSGWTNLWRLNPATREAKQCTFYDDAAVRYPSSDGKRVIFQHGGSLSVFDVATGKTEELSFDMASDRVHSREQRIPLAPEVGPATLFTNGASLGVLGNGIALGPTGKRVLLEARGQIVSVATEAGDMRVLEKKPGTRARFPIWSPDGKRFAFISDRTGENEIWIGDAAGGSEPKQLTKGLASNPLPPIWSPDGKWIAIYDRNGRCMLVDVASGAIKVVDEADRQQAYDALTGTAAFSPDSKFLAYSRVDPNWLYSVNVYDIAGSASHRMSRAGVSSYAPAFDSTGKFLLYLSDNAIDPTMFNVLGKYYLDKTTRVTMLALAPDAISPFLPKNDEEGQAAEAKPVASATKAAPIDLDGALNREIAVPIPAGHYSVLDTSPGHILVLGHEDNPSPDGPPKENSSLLSFDLDKRSSTVLITGIDEFQKSYDGKRILFAAGRQISVHDIDGPTTMSAGVVNLSPYTITYQPEAEWRQIFEESWRIARDFYFDPNMHGLNWPAIRAKYEARLSRVGDRGDLSRLLKDMVSELNTGHAYIGGPSVPGRLANMGFLGIDVEPAAGAVKITKMYRGDAWSPDVQSPLLEPGFDVKVGDYILEIAGQAVKPDQDIQSLLLGTSGQTVAVMVNGKPSREGARVIRVRPMGSEFELRQQDWVVGREKYVLEHGGAEFGYAYIPDMTGSGLSEFVKGQTANTYKTAMIYDTRYNGGGFISSLILEDIASTVTSWFKPRYGNPWPRETWANIGYKAALCNEGNFSDGELFIEAWKRLKIGPVVGTRTGGGEVGSGGGYELIDHGTIFVPNYGAYMDGDWIIEGKGASPTVPVEQDPNDVMAGRDPQLDRAIAILKEQLAKHPIVVPPHPAFRVMKGGK